MKKIMEFIYRTIELKKLKRAQNRARLVRRLKKEMKCPHVSWTTPPLFLGKVMGEFRPYNNSISINSKANGVLLLDTAFHEDQHYIQNTTSHRSLRTKYTPITMDLEGYYKHPCEVNARRVAYVKTMRYLVENYPNKLLVRVAYKRLFHPFTGWNFRLLKLTHK